MKLILRATKNSWNTNELVIVQVVVVNDSYEAVGLDRRLLVGPNPMPDKSPGIPMPISVEPAFPKEEQNMIMLNPFCFYGRERSWSFHAGQVTFYGYLLSRAVDQLALEGPKDAEALALAAEPLVLVIQ